MTDDARSGLDLRDEDRLPWLEAVDEDEVDLGVSPARLVGFILLGVVIIGAIVGGIWYLQSRGQAGEGDLIAAQEGDYKVKATDSDAKSFQGEGDTVYAASAGEEGAARIDVSKIPEAPVVGKTKPEGEEGSAAKPGKSVEAKVAADSAKPAQAQSAAKPAPTNGSVIQLGAYDSNSVANTAWKTLSGRFPYVADLNHEVQSAVVSGKTYYRLRATVGSAGQAKEICGKLRVAGENCLVVG